MDYLELNVKLDPIQPFGEILIAQLVEFGFDSFVDTDEGVQAYGPVDQVDMDVVIRETLIGEERDDVKMEYTTVVIESQNWNAVWEADFEPVNVEEYVSILAPFHDRTLAKGMVIEILPKMSFGTGHHQTTWMMSKALFEMGGMPARVLDMGTGTGVLAFIAEKLGAEQIVAVDIEDWSVENTIENAERNNCTKIEALHGDVDILDGRSFDMILANINRNVLVAHMASYAKMLVDNGILMLSGFFDSDVNDLVANAAQYGLEKVHVYQKDNWCAIKLMKKG